MPTGLEIPNAQEKSHTILSPERYRKAFAGSFNLFLSHRLLCQVYKEVVIKDSQKSPKLLVLTVLTSKMQEGKTEKQWMNNNIMNFKF